VYNTILNLKDICPDDVQILFTVSPVRHTKDGMIENQLSKSKLITAIHEMIDELDYCHYLPVYEILMDDLRDYRFYKEDMIHPNNQAINYIFENSEMLIFRMTQKISLKKILKFTKRWSIKPATKKIRNTSNLKKN
jgi:hypothetical protein